MSRLTPLKRVRLEKGLTLKEVGRLTGIDCGTLSRLEHRRVYPYPSWRRRLSEALGVPEEVLFEEVSAGGAGGGR